MRASEFGAVTTLTDRVFSRVPGDLAASRPHAYDPEHPERHAVVEVEGDIVAHANCIPRTLAVGGSEVDCWGIGGVVTDPRHRGEGHMSALLEFWLDRMDAEDVPLSELGGDRQRYGHFGWEVGARELRYEVTERSFAAADTPGRAGAEPTGAATGETGTLTTYDGSEAALDLVQSLHDAEPLRVTRDREEYRTVLGQRGLQTLVYDHPDRPAYLCFTRGDRERTVPEFGGSTEGVAAALAHVFAAYDTGTLSVHAPPAHPLSALFERISTDWTVRYHRMLRVNDLLGALEGFAAQLERRWAEAPGGSGSITLGVADDSPAVELACDAGTVSVTPHSGSPEIELDRPAMTRLLFGFETTAPEHKEGRPVLSTVLPLDLFVWGSEYV
jgi:predicted acetyltransferase